MIRQITARPFVCVLIGMLVGLNLDLPFWIVIIGVVFATVIKQLWLCWFSLGFALASASIAWQPNEKLPSGPFRGDVLLTGFAEYRQGMTIVPFRNGVIKFPGQIPVAAWERWSVVGDVTEAKGGVIRAANFRRISASPLSFIGDIRVKAINRINALYGERDGPWVNALTFNFASDLTRSDRTALVQSGTFHLVSASGLHVWVLALFAHFLLVAMGVKRHHQIVLISILLFGYCTLTGFHPPTVRSALMWLITCCAYLVKRSPDGLSAICLAGILWLSFAPMDVFTPSFQLSYVVTAALIVWFEKHQDGEWWRGFEVSCVASLAAEPLGAWWFGRIILIGPITNVLVELTSSIVVILGFFSAIPGIGEVISVFCRPLLWWMQRITELASRFPSISIVPRSTPPILLIGYYVVFLIILWGRSRRSSPKELPEQLGTE